MGLDCCEGSFSASQPEGCLCASFSIAAMVPETGFCAAGQGRQARAFYSNSGFCTWGKLSDRLLAESKANGNAGKLTGAKLRPLAGRF